MTFAKKHCAFGLAIAFLVSLAASAFGEVDQGSVARRPWSGYWWKHRNGGLVEPLAQYDALTGAKAAAYERNNIDTDCPSWFGYCHAWSAAACCELEPRQTRTVGGVTFGVGHQKGLLCACHDQDVANSYGDRYGDGNGSEDPDDIYPCELWRLLQTYIKHQRIPIVLDIDCGSEVWNYPIYDYRVDYRSVGGGWYDATMQITAADDDVDPDYVGTEPLSRTYTFRVRIENGAIVLGSGQWTGDSIADHPDFGWYPYVAVAGNPEIDFNQVAKIVGFPVGGTTPPPDETRPPDNLPPDGILPGTQTLFSVDELLSLVLNRTSSFSFDISVDRFDNGKYKEGEPIRVQGRSGETGFLYLFDVGPGGQLTLVCPVADQPNQIEKDKMFDVPVAGNLPWFRASTPGQHVLKAVVTAQPITITGFKSILPPGQRPKGLSAAPTVRVLAGNPTTTRRLSKQISEGLRAGSSKAVAPPEKLGRFAQDMCIYFVTPADR